MRQWIKVQFGFLIFKLEEEVNMSLLLLLPAAIAEALCFGFCVWFRLQVDCGDFY
jgi:hypothetical protein